MGHPGNTTLERLFLTLISDIFETVRIQSLDFFQKHCNIKDWSSNMVLNFIKNFH